MSWITLAAFFVIVFAASFAGTRAVLPVLRKRAILDYPNERSSHSQPTPHGGGIAVIIVLILAWTVIGIQETVLSLQIMTVVGCTIFLAAVSWYDDLHGLPPLVRLLMQAIAITVILVVTPVHGTYFADLLPPILDLLTAGFFWLWFVNLFNFMDGIDGIASAETACIGIGIVIAAGIVGMDGTLSFLALTTAASALGFLWWNWYPAKIFLGDVGSVPLGFLLGWLLLSLAASGQWAAALILPLYYLADSTITLSRRALRGERIWQAHRQHYYQRAVQRGLSHATVVRAICLVNFLLMALAGVAASGLIWTALAAAAVTTAVLLVYLGGWKQTAPANKRRS